MYDDYFTGSKVSILCLLGPMAMILSKFTEILRSPPSPKVIERTGKVLHPLSQTTSIDFKVFVTGLTYVP